MKGFNIAPPGSTGSLAPVAEFSTSLDNFDNQHEILSSTLSTLFTNNFMHKKTSCCVNGVCTAVLNGGVCEKELPTQVTSSLQTTPKYNKSTLKPYNKRIAGHKKRWGENIKSN